MRNDVPTASEISKKIRELELSNEKAEAAALHLATATSALVGVQVRIEEETYRWRGAKVSRGGDLESICSQAAALGVIGWRSGDRFLSMEGSCLKSVRSGAYILIGGSFLHGGPEILCDTDEDQAVAVAEQWLLRGGRHSGVIEVAGEQYLAHGDERVMRIHRTNGTGRTKTTKDPLTSTRVGELIAEKLHIDDIEAATIGTRCPGTIDVDYVGTIETAQGPYQVVVPCTIGIGVSIGAPSGVAVPNLIGWQQAGGEGEPWYEIEGYTTIEPARLEPGWVARHEATSTNVIIRKPREVW